MTAGQILQVLDGSLRPHEDWRMDVVDEFQNPLYSLRMDGKTPLPRVVEWRSDSIKCPIATLSISLG